MNNSIIVSFDESRKYTTTVTQASCLPKKIQTVFGTNHHGTRARQRELRLGLRAPLGGRVLSQSGVAQLARRRRRHGVQVDALLEERLVPADPRAPRVVPVLPLLRRRRLDLGLDAVDAEPGN